MTDGEYSELVDRAKRREPGCREALLAELRPFLIGLMLGQFRKLDDGHADMLANSEFTLLRWLEENPDLVKRDQPAGVLAWRLLSQTGKQWVRDRAHERQAVQGLKREMNPGQKRDGQTIWGGPPTESSFEVAGADATRAIETLGEPHRSTLLAEVEHKLHGGPTLEERFALEPAAARKRLSRAREALLLQIRQGKDGTR